MLSETSLTLTPENRAPDFVLSAKGMTQIEKEEGDLAVKAAGGYAGSTLLSVILISFLIGCYAGHLTDGDGLLGFGCGWGVSFVALLPIWMRARAYHWDAKRRHAYMDRT